MDSFKVFTQPVSEEEVPGYHRIITKPMDLQKMKQRLEKGHYKSVADLRIDFTLMMDNCLKFNRNNRFFYDYGQRIKRIGLSVLKTAEMAQTNAGEVWWSIYEYLNKALFIGTSAYREVTCKMEHAFTTNIEKITNRNARQRGEANYKREYSNEKCWKTT